MWGCVFGVDRAQYVQCGKWPFLQPIAMKSFAPAYDFFCLFIAWCAAFYSSFVLEYTWNFSSHRCGARARLSKLSIFNSLT